jgi:hypothetical protein
MVRRAMSAATALLAPQRSETDRKAAQALLDAATTERWVARALAATTDDGRVRGCIRDLQAAGAAAVDAYVAALSLARTQMRYRTLAACNDLFSAVDIEQSITRCIAADPHAAGALAPFIHQVLPADLLTLLKPALLHARDDVRRGSFVGLERLGVEWRDDLYVRGMLDVDEQVRLAAIRAIARGNWQHLRLLIDRLAGRVGSNERTEIETQLLGSALKQAPGRGVSTRIGLTLCVLALWPGRSRDSRPLEAALRARPRTAIAWLALLLCRISPVQFAHRRLKRQEAAQHG